jgi:hypothetical protein
MNRTRMGNITIRDLLFHPSSFFSGINKDRIDLLIPALIVGAGGIIDIAIVVLPYLWLSPGHAYVILSPVAGFIVLFATPFISWVLIAIALFACCRLQSGKGSFAMTFQSSGYGMFPLVFTHLAGLSGTAFLDVPLPVIRDIMISLFVVTMACIVWSGYIWKSAMQVTHGISRKRALIAASIVVVLYILVTTGLPVLMLYSWIW